MTRKTAKPSPILSPRQAGVHSVLKHIKLGRINANNVINPNVVNGTSVPDATRHGTKSVTNIKCCLINAILTVNKPNMLQSMLLEV